jgi:hypothetical protein
MIEQAFLHGFNSTLQIVALVIGGIIGVLLIPAILLAVVYTFWLMPNLYRKLKRKP